MAGSGVTTEVPANVSPSAKQKANVREEVWKILLRSNVEEQRLKDVVVPYFAKERIHDVTDLEYVEKEELLTAGLTNHEVKKLLKVFNPGEDKQKSSSKVRSGPGGEVDGDLEENTDIRYIPCQNLFASDIKEKTIKGLDLKKTTMSSLLDGIATEMRCGEEHTVELFSSEGYPMNQNCVTGNATLDKWKINQGALFFAIPRKRSQPDTVMFASLPKIDHDVGLQTITVEAPICGRLEVRTFIDVDSAEDIAQKIYSVTDIDVPHMTLFIRKEWHYTRLNTFTDLKDEDTIRVVLRDPVEVIAPRKINYGKLSYNPMVKQSDHGMSKFYSILKFLCSNPRLIDQEKLLSHLMKLSGFPPLIYSLRTLFNYSCLSLAGWVALVEGCFHLFMVLLATIANVPDDEIFEYSDYLWALLIHKSEQCADTSDVKYRPVSLLCPLSGERILFPVSVPGCDEYFYDKYNVLAKLEAKENLISHGASENLCADDLVVDGEIERLLMYFPWETDKEVPVWLNPPKFDIRVEYVCKKIIETIDWQNLSCNLRRLFIVNPEGLDAGDECLTYIEGGRLVFYEGFSKESDTSRVIYDPLSCSPRSFTKKKLEELGRQSLQTLVCKDLTKVLHSDILSAASEEEKDQNQCNRIAAIIQPGESIQWIPEEAIVILLDHSGSMESKLFDELSQEKSLSFNQLEAAKEVFIAFATQTGAIRLHHSFGLTLFGSEVTIQFQLNKRAEKFCENIQDVAISGSTALSPAMMSGIDQLVHYTSQFPSCLRRLFCLTDGEDTGGIPYDRVLQYARENDVVIDTVLLTGTCGNVDQKAISHASGGICVLPSNPEELLTLLEMETVLSLRARVPKSTPTGDLHNFMNTDIYPYETIAALVSSKYSKYSDSFKDRRTFSLERSLAQDLKPQNVKQQRICRELRNIQVMDPPHPDVAVFPSEEVYDHWKVLLRGPNGSPYEGGSFVLSVVFPKMYPAAPPEIKFVTPIFHCNVARGTGRICHEILRKNYTPSLSMVTILCNIYGLLVFPAFDSPLESAMAEFYLYNNTALMKQEFKNYKEYCRQVQLVMNQQTKTFEELKKELEDAK